MVIPEPSAAHSTPSFFGTEAELAQAGIDRGSPDLPTPVRRRATLHMAWWSRQRDTAQALAWTAELEAELSTDGASAAHPAMLGRLALVRGEAALLQHRLAEALEAVDRAAHALRDDDVGQGDAMLLRASILDRQGGDRLPCLREALDRFRRSGHPDRIGLAMTWLACVEATDDPEQTQARWGPALDDAIASGDPGLQTFALAARGTVTWRQGDPGAAIPDYQRGFEAALACGQRQSAITLAQNIGIAFSLLNDHEGALDWADRARGLAESTGWPYAIGWCLMQTGSILLSLGRARAAHDLLLDGMCLFDGSQGSRDHVLACQVLGEACIELQDDRAALHWCALALQGARRAPFQDLIAGSLRYVATAQSRLGDVRAALATAEEARALAQAQSDWARLATIHQVLAEIAARHALPPPAGASAASAPIHHLEAALRCGERISGFSPPPEWLEALSAAQEAAGDLAAALRSQRDAATLRQARQVRRAEEHATAMLIRHRTAQAEAEAARQHALAEASELRAALTSTQSALEQERLQRMLVHAGKLAAIGRLAAGVVHEMSHPVGTVTLIAEALQAQLGEVSALPSALRAGTDTLVHESRRLQYFVTRLREFARAEPLQLARHDLAAVLADARHLYAPRLAVDRIALHVDAPAVDVLVDPQRLALAVANLVFNAADALAGRPRPRVDIGVEQPAERLLIHVDDNGPGLSAAARERLFEPFFTTRPEGLGLGLVLSAESLAAMGGRLQAGASPSGGARFTIELPRVA